jgi:hypothetical protein
MTIQTHRAEKAGGKAGVVLLQWLILLSAALTTCLLALSASAIPPPTRNSPQDRAGDGIGGDEPDD